MIKKCVLFAIAISFFANTLLAECPLNRRRGGAKLNISSTAFQNNGLIPSKYTCDGDDINPSLQISGVPKTAKSLALIVDDPDAPMKKPAFVHWVVWNIPPSTTSIAENSVPGDEGMTDFGKKGFGGACPPSGTHRYFFKVYALDTQLDLPESTTKPDLEKAMQGHIIGQAQLVGLYARRK